MSDELVEEHWNIDAIISDLRAQKWQRMEPGQIGRDIYLGSYDLFRTLASQTVIGLVWKEAVLEGWVHEVVEDYMQILADVLSERMGEDVYVSYDPDEPGKIIAGQVKKGDIEELRRKGFQIED